jgi:hypothetical protein
MLRNRHPAAETRNQQEDLCYGCGMAPLRNVKHETFARNVVNGAAKGVSIATSYELAGYTTTGHASEAAASRLLNNVEISARVAELQAAAAKKTTVTLASLIDEVDAAIEQATALGQPTVRVSAAALKAKLTGLDVQRVETNEFASCRTAGEVLDALADAIDDVPETLELIDRFRERLLERAGDRARIIEPSVP